MTSTINNPQEYIDQLPEDRKSVVAKLREILNQNLDAEFSEQMSYGMLTWVVPHSKYPEGYHVDPKQPLPFISLASQKNYIALYHLGLYSNPELLKWFEQEYAKTGHKLDMGKSCIRFKKPDQIPYQLISELASKISANQYIASYEQARTNAK